jgi:hypothetical protein
VEVEGHDLVRPPSHFLDLFVLCVLKVAWFCSSVVGLVQLYLEF